MTPDLAVRLRDARTERGDSLEAVAGPAKISPAYLHKLEAGKVTTPSPRVLQRLGEVLDLPYWELMDLAGYVPGGEPPPRRGRSAAPAGGDYSTRRIVELLEAMRAELGEVRAQIAAR